MTKRMLIDGTHAEETRVVVLDGTRLEDFDVETSTKKQLKGNIYLAKVVRVEPSLQAAFVEYGGNRHGFLAFGEIHPDYYQIPAADRQRLIALQEEEARAAEAEEDAAAEAEARGAGPEAAADADTGPAEALAMAAPAQVSAEVSAEALLAADAAALAEFGLRLAPDGEITGSEDAVHALREALAVETRASGPTMAAAAETLVGDVPELGSFGETGDRPAIEADDAESGDAAEGGAAEAPPPETLGGETEAGEDRERRTTSSRLLRNYRIQEVIRRRQILLVQVVKEERGAKGAALTTYISLAGRFCVLMPNSPRGGGISRKITSVADRRRLKEVTAELDLPRGMGLIVRTAGAARPKAEIMRDCEYLLQLWDEIRETTLKSIAPALIYEEASLIRRSIRDVYSRDVEEVLVAGEPAWRAARDQMRLLMPSHANKVRLWADPTGTPIFVRHGVEAQLDAMFGRSVPLKSGGYLVIDQTEALVSIDVNSGRSTRERNIEETALRTNLEAAEEVARQLRLRDLAGLIVIDFIDMETRRHNVMVEKRLKDALKTDRARIQVGTISAFGLMEMSRQRLRPSLAETSLVACPHCEGTGHVRSTEGAAITTLRAIEEEGAKRRSAEILVSVPAAVALYMLNHKRERLRAIETQMGMVVQFATDTTLLPGASRIERLRAFSEADAARIVEAGGGAPPADLPETIAATEAVPEMAAAMPAAETTADAADAVDAAETASGRRRRRRRRRGGRRDEGRGELANDEAGGEDDDARPEQPMALADTATPPAAQRSAIATEASAYPDSGEAVTGADETRDSGGRRRGRRGGRRRRRDTQDETAVTATEVAPAGYQGPTPADPFGVPFDIFDALEQAEMRATASQAAGSPATRPEVTAATPDAPAPRPEPAPAPTPEAEPEAVPAPEAVPEPVPDAVPRAVPDVVPRAAPDAPLAVTETADAEAPVKPVKPKVRRTRRKPAAEVPPEAQAELLHPAHAEAPAPEMGTAQTAPAAPAPAAPHSGAPDPAASGRDTVDAPLDSGTALPTTPPPVLVDQAPAAPRRGWWRR